MNRFAAIILGFAALFPARAGQAAEPLAPVARVGPWTAISGLIGYRGRVWFANSVKFRDHNSADIYSYHPGTGKVRYERHLFSQDVGRPVVADGLLYWPFEDGRFSMGRGDFMVTDGETWQWRTIPKRLAFHIHAMHAHDNKLYAGTGAFHGRLFRSGDKGRTWRQIYVSKDKGRSFSRLVSVASLGRTLYAGLYSSNEPGIKLMSWRDGALRPVGGWPVADEISQIVSWRGWVYALQDAGGKREVRRTDGTQSQPVAGLKDVFVVALAAGGNRLWAISSKRQGPGGALWASADGLSWRKIQSFDADQPVDLLIHGRRPYVGALGADGRGVLWGPPAPAPAEPVTQPRLLDRATRRPPAGGLEAPLRALDNALAEPGSMQRRGALRVLLKPIVARASPAAGKALSKRLGRVRQGDETSFFAGGKAAAARKADWVMLWAIARIGHGRIPVEMLKRAWTSPPSRGQKYVASAPAAAWAAGEIGQDDPQTLQALIERLARRDDPLWLTGDIVGALTVLTGQRFGYDRAAWRAWWARRRTTQ